MLEVNNKFNIDDELYTVVRKPIEYECPVCKGTGEFVYNGYSVKCQHCSGKGKHWSKNTLWCVVDDKVKIRRIIVSIWKDVTTCSYRTVYKGTDLNITKRPESHLFLTREEAEQLCINKNKVLE